MAASVIGRARPVAENPGACEYVAEPVEECGTVVFISLVHRERKTTGVACGCAAAS
jgi:hypothetical protein